MQTKFKNIYIINEGLDKKKKIKLNISKLCALKFKYFNSYSH